MAILNCLAVLLTNEHEYLIFTHFISTFIQKLIFDKIRMQFSQ